MIGRWLARARASREAAAPSFLNGLRRSAG
jgi:hypothetical protein